MKKEEKLVLEETIKTIFSESNEKVRLCFCYFHKSVFGGCHETLCEDEIYLNLNTEDKYWLEDEFNNNMSIGVNGIKKYNGTLHIRGDKTDYSICIQYLYENKVEITLRVQKHFTCLGYDYKFKCSLTTIKKLLKQYAKTH